MTSVDEAGATAAGGGGDGDGDDKDETPGAAAEGTAAPAATGDDAGTGPGGPDEQAREQAGRGLSGELWLLLELAGLCAFAFSKPVLDSFGRSPETFSARGADAGTVVAFGVVVTVVPIVAVAVIGAIGRAFGPRARWRAHLGLVGVLGGLAVWRIGQDITGWPPEATKLLLAGALAVPLIALVRLRLQSSRSFLRYAGIASAIFLAQFLFTSPASSLISGGTPGLDDEVTGAVDAALGDDAPPIVFLVLDAFPTQVLVDGTGQIDEGLYPNIASLASTASWYRNNTTVSAFTNEAVPALLSGVYPEPGEGQGGTATYPNNLFTLFGGTYDMHVREPITRLCPEEVCAERPSGGLGPLLGDAVDLWTGETGDEGVELDIPGLFTEDRYDQLESWIDEQDFTRGSRPDLFFYHALLPHEPWMFLPDGSVYEASDPPAGAFGTGWSPNGADTGRQRIVMQAQAADRLVGRLLDRMREAGTYDDALVVLAADHGQSFTGDQPWRAVSEENYEQIMWAPLIVKAPGQAEGEVNDDNVQSIDVLPTIADRLGLELPFEVDGLVAGGDEQRDPDVKELDDVETNDLRAEDGEDRLEVAAQPGLDALMVADPVPATGEDAVFKRTAHHDLVGRPVSDLATGAGDGGSVAIEGLDRLDEVDVDDPLPIEALGVTDLATGDVVAFTLNGTVAGVTTVGADSPDGRFVQSLLLPRLFEDGANELGAYRVTGPVGTESLAPLELDGRD